MMFRDMVESVMLLKEEACNHTHTVHLTPASHIKTTCVSLRPSRQQYPLQARGALFPASSVAFEEPGGGALLCGAAEPARSRSGISPTCITHKRVTPTQASSSPAHGVIVIGVTEAGGLQLAAHHGAGALVPRQVALQSALPVHAGTWDTHRQAHAASGPAVFFGFYLVGVPFLTPACCDDTSIFTRLGRWERSSPCGSRLSLWRGLSLLKETTDSVSVCSSSVSTLPVAFGL